MLAAQRGHDDGMSAQRPGRVILLNGTSSSGKTSIARCLLNLLDPPHFHMAVDAVGAMRAAENTRGLAPGDLPALLRRTRAGFHRAVAGMAAAGNDIVIDHVLSEPGVSGTASTFSLRSTSPSSRCAAHSRN